MKLLEDRIRKEGRILPGPVLKVSSFLNHQMDPALIMEMGRETGIAVALAAGYALGVPVLFAKKHRTSNVSGNLYQTMVHSYTHGTDYTVVVEREFLHADDRVLIVDDFLANGKAVEGLLDLIRQAGAEAAGAAIAVEKAFQEGGQRLRAAGLRVESLAAVRSMDESGIIFCGE